MRSARQRRPPAVVLKKCVQIEYERSAAVCKCKHRRKIRRHLRPIVRGVSYCLQNTKTAGKSHPATVNHHSHQAESAWCELVVDGCWGLFSGYPRHPAQARPAYASLLRQSTSTCRRRKVREPFLSTWGGLLETKNSKNEFQLRIVWRPASLRSI